MDPLTVPGTVESLDDVGKYARDAAVAAGLSKEAVYKLRLAVDELATNIVMHAYGKSGVTGDITIAAEVTDRGLEVTIEDSGPPYDPRTARMPNEEDLAKPLEERTVGGLGVFLTLKSVDAFDYRRVGNRNRSIVVMRLGDRANRKAL